MAALRALPGLADDWSGFSKCSYFGGQDRSATGSPGCGAAGLAPVAVSPLSPLPVPFLCPDGFGRVPQPPPPFMFLKTSSGPCPFAFVPLSQDYRENAKRSLSGKTFSQKIAGGITQTVCPTRAGGLQDAASVAGSEECACCGIGAPRGHDDSGVCIAGATTSVSAFPGHANHDRDTCTSERTVLGTELQQLRRVPSPRPGRHRRLLHRGRGVPCRWHPEHLHRRVRRRAASDASGLRRFPWRDRHGGTCRGGGGHLPGAV